jgi:quinol monooxygenase YgiN
VVVSHGIHQNGIAFSRDSEIEVLYQGIIYRFAACGDQAKMYIISPLSKCSSPVCSDRVGFLLKLVTYGFSHREQFLDFISKIDVVTHKTEPGTIAYAWFRGADDNDTVPGHWVRGFEAYETVEANQVAHRASDEYKAFRKTVADESLLESPSDLRFWRPTGIGFLTREDKPISFRGGEGQQHVVIDQFTPAQGAQGEAVAALRRLASAATENERVSSFWVLDRGSDGDDGLYVFACYESKDAWSTFEAGDMQRLWGELKGLSRSEDWVRTTWKASGIGFIGR